MVKLCLHCHRKLDFLPAVRGELFCSPEHREFYLDGQIAFDYTRNEVTINPSLFSELTSPADARERIVQTPPVPPMGSLLSVLVGNRPIKPARKPLDQSFCEAIPPTVHPTLPSYQGSGPIGIPAAAELIFTVPKPPRSVRPWAVSGLAGAVLMTGVLVLGAFPRLSPIEKKLSKAESIHSATPAPPPSAPEVAPFASSADSTPLAFHIISSPALPSISTQLDESTLPPVPPLPELIPPQTFLESTSPAVIASPVRHASIEVTTTSWISACSDGKEVLRRLLWPGDTRQIEFSDKALLRVGNAGGVRVVVEGREVRSLGLSGLSGVLRVIEFGPRGSRLLALPPGDDGNSDCVQNYPRLAVR